MPDTNTRYGPGPTQSQASKDGEHRVPRSHRHQKEDPRDLNRNGRQEGQDRSRTIPPPEYEHRSPEKRPTQDRNNRVQEHDRRREERTQVGKEASRDRHRDGRSRQQRHQDAGSRDRHREDRSRDRVDQSRYQEEGTQDRYWDERSQDKHHKKTHSREQDRYWDERGQSFPRDPREVEFHQESSNYKKEAFSLGYGPSPQSPSFDEREYYESRPKGGILECNKCRYLCTGRACCQLVEVLLNMLILICASVSYGSTGGFTGITNMGGIYYYAYGGAYSGFSGADGEKAQLLDVQFYQLKLPTVSASMAFGGALMGFSCLMILIGVFRLPWYFPIWLLVECILDVLIACGYVPALYFYFRMLLDAYATQVCTDREALYKSKGYDGFSCSLHGADIAAALFGCVAIGVFAFSAVLAIRGFRRVRILKKQQSAQKLEL